jgi:hypothetical protein
VILLSGVEVAEKLSEAPLFGAEAPQPAQLHQNYKPTLARYHVDCRFFFLLTLRVNIKSSSSSSSSSSSIRSINNNKS